MSTEMSTGDSSESFTPAEAAYFKSGGTDTAALEAENAGTGGESSAPVDRAPVDGRTGGESDIENPDELVTLGPDGKPRDGKGRFVPHQAFHEVREKYKATRDELQTTREKMARADERLNVLNDILGQADRPAQAAQEEINPDTDPIGALNHAMRKIQALESQLTESKQQSEARENSKAMQDAYLRDAQSYLTETPDFKDAYGYLMSSRHQELEAAGVHDVMQRNRLIAQEERSIVQNAFQSRLSPAQMLHKIAIARGFKPASVPAKDAANDPMKRIGELAQAQKTAGASLTNAGGTSGEGLTLAALADMDEEQFAAVSAKLGKAKMRELMGG
jgi:hypothetical protein